MEIHLDDIRLVTHSFADGLVELGKVVFSHVGGAVAGHVHAVLHISILGDLLLYDVGDTGGLKKCGFESQHPYTIYSLLLTSFA